MERKVDFKRISVVAYSGQYLWALCRDGGVARKELPRKGAAPCRGWVSFEEVLPQRVERDLARYGRVPTANRDGAPAIGDDANRALALAAYRATVPARQSSMALALRGVVRETATSGVKAGPVNPTMAEALAGFRGVVPRG